MEIRYISETTSFVRELTGRLTNELENHDSVLWFVTGGSNIALDVAVLNSIPDTLKPKLTMTLTDERYGLYDHPDSNTRQLREAGFKPGAATYIPVLTHANASLEATTAGWRQTVSQQLETAGAVIAIFGLGSDGHIAGILPETPAANSNELVVGYETEQFTRITLGFEAIKRIQAAYMYAGGESKREPLQNLQNSLPLTAQPSQILKSIPEHYIYTDQQGVATS